MPLLFAHNQTEFAHLIHRPCNEEAGAYVTFLGTVRKFNRNKEVSHLFYEAYEELAYKQFLALEEKTQEQFYLLSIEAIHLLGEAQVGDTAVYIRVSAVHRHEAFVATRFLIDELKKTVPIWKKEHYSDGTFAWDQGFCQCDAEADSGSVLL
jgi:molybdopterin synthase catalytic subunit